MAHENNDIVTINITVKMKQRWVSHFLGMLKKMEKLGDMGASRYVALYSDGDGDFQPKFEWDSDLPVSKGSNGTTDVETTKFDAG